MKSRRAAEPPRTTGSVHGQAVDRLGGEIVAGRHPPGSTLPPEPLLGEALGVSRTVVREAIKSLVAKGLITTGPKVGTRVQSPDDWNWFDAQVMAWQSRAGLSDEFLRDLQDLRQVVEPAAAQLAAHRATAQDLQELELAYEDMRAAIHLGGDPVPPDLRFHQGLLRASHNRLLAHMGRALGALLRSSFERSSARGDAPGTGLLLHRAVLDGVIARDPPQAEAAMRALIDDAGRDIGPARPTTSPSAPAGAVDAGPVKPATRSRATTKPKPKPSSKPKPTHGS